MVECTLVSLYNRPQFIVFLKTWSLNPLFIRFCFSKKKKMSNIRGDANEKYLYHGTLPDTIDYICAQNFDFRMSGKHATKYGKGSYFATTATYSHNYSKEDSQGYFAMFVGQVLVGKYTKVMDCLLWSKIAILVVLDFLVRLKTLGTKIGYPISVLVWVVTQVNGQTIFQLKTFHVT